MRINYWQSEGWPDQIGSCECPGLSLVEAKRLLREKGGVAFTAFFDREVNTAMISRACKEKPKNCFRELPRLDAYKDWFDTEAEALAFLAEARRA
jgi:hypothetical protein